MMFKVVSFMNYERVYSEMYVPYGRLTKKDFDVLKKDAIEAVKTGKDDFVCIAKVEDTGHIEIFADIFADSDFDNYVHMAVGRNDNMVIGGNGQIFRRKVG